MAPHVGFAIAVPSANPWHQVVGFGRERYIRAWHRLKEILASLPDGIEEFRP
jgi:hypothetical protein